MNKVVIAAFAVGAALSSVLAYLALTATTDPASAEGLVVGSGFFVGVSFIVLSERRQRKSVGSEAKALSGRGGIILGLAVVAAILVIGLLPPLWSAAYWSAAAGVLSALIAFAVAPREGPSRH